MGTPAGIPSGTVTFAFTDVEDSTVLMRRLGARYRPLLRRHNEIVRSAVDASGGHIVKSEGDGFFVAFASADAAVESCIRAQLGLRREEWPDDAPFAVRMGLHAGHALPDDGDYVALAVHQAARVAAAAHGGQILVSDVVCSLLEDTDFSFESLGRFRLKGFEGSRELFQVVHPELPHTFPPLRAAPAAARHLPRPRTSFIGRTQELRVAGKLLAESRVVTIVGAGGTGKTRLAIEAARDRADDYRDGVWFVDLSAADPSSVVAVIAAAVSYRPSGEELSVAGIASHLGHAHALLVLDNCEHVIDAAAEAVAILSDECDALSILATSRAPLRVGGEAVFPLPTLELPDDGDAMGSDAVRLFVDRASAVTPSFSTDAGTLASVAEIVRRLDGLPLAIELAAARAGTIGTSELGRRLDDILTALPAGPRTATPRQRTVRALIDWSHDLLSEAEKVVFRRLSVFASGFTLAAAEEVVADGEVLPSSAVLALVQGLAEKSLLVVGGDAMHRRFRMLATIRAYAEERLQASGESDATRSRLLAWALELAEEAARELLGPAQGAWIERLDDELDNLRAALAAASELDESSYVALVTRLSRFWTYRDYGAEGRRHVAVARALSDDDATVAKLLTSEARLALADSDYSAAATAAGQAVDAARALGDLVVLTLALQAAGEAAFRAGHFSAARGHFQESLDCAADDLELTTYALQGLGSVERDDGNLDVARPLLERAVKQARIVGQPTLIAASCGMLGELCLYDRNAEAARELFAEELLAARNAGSRHLITFALGDIANAAHMLEDYDEAGAQWTEALEVAESTSNRQGMARAHTGLGVVALYTDDLDSARHHLRLAAGLAREVKHAALLSQTANFLARVEYRSGDMDKARAEIVAAALDLGEDGPKAIMSQLLQDLSELSLEMGDGDTAAAVAGLRDRLLNVPEPPDAGHRPAGDLRQALGDETFELHWHQGYQRSLDDLLAPLGTN